MWKGKTNNCENGRQIFDNQRQIFEKIKDKYLLKCKTNNCENERQIIWKIKDK